MSEHVNETLRWIPLVPLLGAVLSGLLLIFWRRELPRSAVIAIGCGTPLLSFGIALNQVFRLAVELPEGKRFFTDNLYTWISAGSFHAEMGFLLDPLSAVMVLVVTGPASC